uniref:Putative regulator n=1 Tax=Brevibacterium sp. HCU TaxID=133406 RepID=Q93QG0_9MICO|nr:putative regulator [Brevibacterium sp. HCU]
MCRGQSSRSTSSGRFCSACCWIPWRAAAPMKGGVAERGSWSAPVSWADSPHTARWPPIRRAASARVRVGRAAPASGLPTRWARYSSAVSPRSPASPRRRRCVEEVPDDAAGLRRPCRRRRTRRLITNADRRTHQVPHEHGPAVGNDHHQCLGITRARPADRTGRSEPASASLAPGARHGIPRRLYDVFDGELRNGPASPGTSLGRRPGQRARHPRSHHDGRGDRNVARRPGLAATDRSELSHISTRSPSASAVRADDRRQRPS